MTQSKRKARIAAKHKSEKIIQIVAGVIVLGMAAWILWALTSSQKPAASLPASAGAVEKKTYAKAPDMTIDKNKKYTASFKLAKGGEFKAQLYPDKAPITVNSFVFLAREKYFDGTTFHRVLEGFMA